MTVLDIVEKVKTDLRITHTALDEDITDMVSACLDDLDIAGVRALAPYDATVVAAVKLYCRAAYTDDTGKADAYMARYNAMKSTMMMAERYKMDE